ncbi:MAG: type I polyketide synthase [Desulfatirhabdiaceae bacterium]
MAQDTIEEGIEPIAIIGMGCRFPDASNINEFRDNLLKGKESVTVFTRSEMLAAGADESFVSETNYVDSACVLENIEMFDHQFFGYTREEAEFICPQQRILLECAYEALEDAGCPVKKEGHDIGVFGGMRTSGYARVLGPVLNRAGSADSFQALLGTSVDQLCMRISHALNLKGPSLGIQTACSASTAAIHVACESLRNGECSMALAGASSILIPQRKGYIYDPDTISSPDGHCRAFDTGAQGTISGNGAGMVLLRPLSDAIKNHDHIYAVIRASAVNNDGSEKAAYRTPSIEGQARVIEEALLMSGVGPENITYVEANGTGTFLGDSIEVEALSRVFRMTTDKKYFCGIGSVKTNIGHLTQASGIAGLIKTVLSLKYKELYPSLNCDTPNPSLTDSPFYVVRKQMKWKADNGPRRAGLNSFAIGGTNFHLILEQSPLQIRTAPSGSKNRSHILTISTKKEHSLRRMVHRYKTYLESNPDAGIEDICFTSNVGRFHYPWRFSSVAGSKKELLGQINNWLNDSKGLSVLGTNARKDIPKVGFLFSDCSHTRFPGIKSFYSGQACFRDAIDQCLEILRQFGKAPSSVFDSQAFNTDQSDPINTFIVEYALSAMWKSWGIVPVAVMGEGIGKYLSAYISGESNLEHVLKQVVENYVAQPSFSDTVPKISKKVSQIQSDWKNNGVKVDIFILIGPDKQLLQQNNSINSKTMVHVHQGDEDEWHDTLQCLSKLYAKGMDIAWDRVTEGLPYYKTGLPTYPFDKKKCWFNG